MSGLLLPDKKLVLPPSRYGSNRLSRWFHNPWPPEFSGCCCKSGPSSPAPNCFTPCCTVQPASTLHLSIGAQSVASAGCAGGTPVPGIDNQVVTLKLDNQTSCHWKGDLVCGSGTPPVGNCGGGASGCDGTNHFNLICCRNPPCAGTFVALLITAAYTSQGNVITLNGTQVNYHWSVILSGTCSPVNFTGTWIGSAVGDPAALCDNCGAPHLAIPRWPVTVTL